MKQASEWNIFGSVLDDDSERRNIQRLEDYLAAQEDESQASRMAAESQNIHDDSERSEEDGLDQHLPLRERYPTSMLVEQHEQELSPFARTPNSVREMVFSLEESEAPVYRCSNGCRQPERVSSFYIGACDSNGKSLQEQLELPQESRTKPRKITTKQAEEEVLNSLALYDPSKITYKSGRSKQKGNIRKRYLGMRQLKDELLSTDDNQHQVSSKLGKAQESVPEDKTVKLKDLSMDVYRVVTEGGEGATFSQVVDEVIELYDRKKYDFKNIKRRIYDCLNVMISSGCLKKVGKSIRPVNKTAASTINKRLEANALRTEYKRRIKYHTSLLEDKKNQAIWLKEKHSATEALRKRNQNLELPRSGSTSEVIPLPFIIVEASKLQESLKEMELEGSRLALPLKEPANFFTEMDALLLLNKQRAFEPPRRRKIRKISTPKKTPQ